MKQEKIEFDLSVSTQAYQGKCNEWGKVKYQTQTIDIDLLENYVREGYSFTHTFKGTKGQVFSTAQKTISNFDKTNTVFIDVDDSPITAPDFYQSVTVKPSLLYTTPSNITGDKNRYRLVYLFENPIVSNEDYKAYINGITYSLSNDIKGFDLKDTTCINCSQQMGGNSYENIILYKTYNVFSYLDFKKYIDEYRSSCTPKEYKKEGGKNIPIGNTEDDETGLEITDREFIADFWSIISFDKLNEKHGYKYPIYEYSQIDELQPFIELNDDYIEIPRRTFKYKMEGRWYERPVRIKSGQRGSILFSNALLRLRITPEMCFEHLLFCLLFERYYWIDNRDGGVDNKRLYKIAKGAYLNRERYSPKMSKSMFRKREKYKTGHKVNPAFCESQGVSARSVANHIRGYVSDKVLDEHYDFTKSVQDNCQILKEKGIKPNSERRLYKYLKDKNIGTKDYLK